MTYAQLIAAIQSYVENTFPATYLADGSTVSSTTQLNTFITQAEQRIFNSVQFPSLRRNVTGFTSASNKYLACPADFLAAYSMAVIDASGNYEYLLNKDVNFIRQAYPQPTDTAIPKYYALFGPSFANSDELSFILGPTPDAVYSVELHYFFYPDSITVAPDGRTWLGDNFDTVLLYGSLVEAYTFMKGEQDVIALYDGKYKEALALAQRLGDGLERSDAYRSGQFRVPPLAQNNGVR
jgi:hypothetical protein